MQNLDPVILGLIAGAVLIVLGLLGLVLRRPPPVLDEDDEEMGFESTVAEPSPRSMPEPSTEKAPKSWKTGLFKKAGSECDHHYQVAGFPADKLGTHYILACEKCGHRMDVEIAKAKEFLRQRDDVRDAVARARTQGPRKP